ncbi:hypothetical protein [Bacillus sp. MRMR6]|uniref:hypothetical protein n=1 Tax=Bacillus sp. MRMR6 TaxID=1928617 RepID=UPI0009517667|nr:hypothetical protein [Bacillus sp. MRMR6]OLS38512.1 hypothetical protein BTR25_13905 [Bacillus sp. MRMR6]
MPTALHLNLRVDPTQYIPPIHEVPSYEYFDLVRQPKYINISPLYMWVLTLTNTTTVLRIKWGTENILTLGRLVEKKGHHVLMQAFKKIKPKFPTIITRGELLFEQGSELAP